MQERVLIRICDSLFKLLMMWYHIFFDIEIDPDGLGICCKPTNTD